MSKASRKEGNRVACLIKKNKAPYYIADVDIKTKEDLISTFVNTQKTLGKTKASFTLIGANENEVLVLSHVLDDCPFSSQEWVEACAVGISNKQDDTDEKYTVFVGEAKFPFKTKDMIRGNGFAFLNKHGCIEDDSESEEFIGFDDI